MEQFSFEKINKLAIYLVILIAASILFFPFLGEVHLFDWDEINFAEAAREMLITGNYHTVQIDFRPFLEKPPFFIWLQAISMNIFGVNEFAARFPNALLGVIQLLVLFHIGKKWHGKNFGILWVIVYASSILPFFYFKSAIIDPWFNFFTFISIYYFIEYLRLNTQRELSIIFSAFFIGLAVLTKGPVAFLVFSISILILILFSHKNINIRFRDILLYFLVLFFVGGSYFIVQIALGNWEIVKQFIIYQIRLFSTQDAGHGGFLFYHFVVLFFGVFPASVLAIPGLFFGNFKTNKSLIYRVMVILLWTVLILFTIVKTKIVHYSSLAYFPISYLAVLSVQYAANKNKMLANWQKWLLVFIATILFIAIVLIQYVGMHSDIFATSDFIKDDFAKANLQAVVHWSGFEFLVGLIPLLGVFLLFFKKFSKSIYHQLIIISAASLFFIYLAQIIFVPRIEKYSQNAAIEFYKEHADEDCYIETVGFKSYAHLFYGKRKFDVQDKLDPKAYSNLILNGAAGKKVYIVTKVDRLQRELKKHPNFRIMYKKNGFVFLERSDFTNFMNK